MASDHDQLGGGGSDALPPDVELEENDDSTSEAWYAGHDAENDHLHLTIPELAAAQTLASATAVGSSQARRRAKIMAWILILAFIGPLAVVVLGELWGWIT